MNFKFILLNMLMILFLTWIQELVIFSSHFSLHDIMLFPITQQDKNNIIAVVINDQSNKLFGWWLTNSNCLWVSKKKNIDFQIYVRELSLLYNFKIHVPILIYKNLVITSLKLPDSDWLHGEISIDRNIKRGNKERKY